MGLAMHADAGTHESGWAHEFAKVVDRVAEEGGDAKVMRALQPFLFGHVRIHVDAREVQE